jgi:hypothetical protein
MAGFRLAQEGQQMTAQTAAQQPARGTAVRQPKAPSTDGPPILGNAQPEFVRF